MAEAYLLLWSQARLRWLRRCGDEGPLEVLFGGPHISMPTLARLACGDCVYVVGVAHGRLHGVARIEVSGFDDPDAFVARRFGWQRPPATGWNAVQRQHPEQARRMGHRYPYTCADQAVLGTGSALRWDRILPAAELGRLALGPRAGQERALSGVVDGRLRSALTLQGHLRRASADSAQRLSHWFAAG